MGGNQLTSEISLATSWILVSSKETQYASLVCSYQQGHTFCGTVLFYFIVKNHFASLTIFSLKNILITAWMYRTFINEQALILKTNQICFGSNSKIGPYVLENYIEALSFN